MENKAVVAITGASGLQIGQRLVEFLSSDYKVYTIITDAAKKVSNYESFDLNSVKNSSHRVFSEDELDSSLASSSFQLDFMVVAPCSMHTLSAIASGYSDSLVSRCADNILKLNRSLILSPRDTPFSLPALENMCSLASQGVSIVPPVIAYYPKPKSLDEATDFFVGKILDSLHIDHSLYPRWGEK